MAGRVRHLVNRSGRYHARVVVPKDLRGIIGKTELRIPLGGDRREALKLLPGAVTQIQHQIAVAEQKANPNQQPNSPARFPLAPGQIAHSHYHQRMALDDQLRNDPRYSAVGIDDLLVERLRTAIAGNANDAELGELVGAQIERFRAAGNLDAAPGSTEWREIARALCHAELEALAHVAERDEGDFTGKPTASIIVNAQPSENAPTPVSIKQLWKGYVAHRQQAGFMRSGTGRQQPVIDKLVKHLKHDDATRVTKKDLIAWRDCLMNDLSAKTVSDVYLSTIRSLFSWAVENEMLTENPTANVRQAKPKKQHTRERGYVVTEANKVLRASRTYQPNEDERGYVREKSHLVDAKRWAPIICAFTGARISEITQLRKEDVRKIDGHWVVRITPDAGSIKTGGYRDAPLHPQIISEGFIDFVEASNPGPMFHGGTKQEDYSRKAKRIANQVAAWLSKSGLAPEGLLPNHAWRHRFKTQCRELGISDRVVDAIQGHAGKTAGDDYGDVTLTAKINAIEPLPWYELSGN
ncbi:DUF6538 domain-containing protein [Ruegeria sp. YS9]|uniref:DUF6538 domain-containing protein n=1 Tax=Ruegeria sp. YS9 TaxID=2966453 RepID=UPI00214C9A29|nr:DUF6538 domain-containing protein [Ruegeria sp. YS9]UUV06548.1 integrase [Ruegeria sp. YS9]